MIKTLVFDLGRVIVPFDLQHAYSGLERLGSLPTEQMRELVGKSDLVTRFESGQIEPEQFVRELGQLLRFETDVAQFRPVWNSIFGRETLVPDSLLELLHHRYRLLLLSNTNAIHFEMIAAEYTELRHFDHMVLSYKVGAMKPDPRIYQEALRHAQCRPEECFYTDDIEAYVEGAREQGIDAEVFTGREALEQHLRRRGVEW